MAFQRSYSKVWWGSDNQQLPSTLALSSAAGGASAINDGTSFTSGGFYYGSYFAQKSQQQLNAQRLQYNNHGSGGYHSLDSGSFRSHVGNLSRIQEVDDEHNNSKLSWGKRDSPGSLRSQDSGFSDNDESHSGRSLGGRSSKPSSPSAKSTASIQSAASSPSSVHSAAVATPPTVIRRVGKSEFYSPLVSVSRRISFSGSPATATALDAAIGATQDTTTQLQQRLTADDLLVSEAVSAAKKLNFDDANACGGLAVAAPQQAPQQAQQQQQPKRRRRIIRQATKPLSPTKRRTLLEDTDADSEEERNVGNDVNTGNSFDELDRSAEHNRSRTRLHIVPEYNNETVYLGVATATTTTSKPYNNETMVLGAGGVISCAAPEDTNNNTMKMHEVEVDIDNTMTPLKDGYLGSTSTPKAAIQHTSAQPWLQMSFRHVTYEYDNPLLNGHAPDLQHWLHDLRATYEQEVMSTLQTKSIAQEAFKNLTITTNTVAKLIRQLQQRALNMQTGFERVERILSGAQEATLHEALASAEQLVANVSDFTQVLERRAVFFNESRQDRKRYEENIAQIRIITKDTRYSLERQHYINLESLLDDVQVLKRNLLISVRQLFEKMVRIIVQSVEQGQCDLMLRANINMIATLMNIDYEGFASLTDAFVQNEAVRALFIVCLENKLSSVRALALRALATVCCSPAAIAQLGACGGIEIVRDIIQVPGKERAGEFRRGDIERREAVSLLTQITAAWHGPEHRVDGLKACAELIVEGLTQLITNTTCPQTLLLCAAALNNLSRIEVTSHYSIMSNEAIFKLIEVVQGRDEETSIFLYEQIVAMLHNMSVNKKCHSHLANGNIINFITSAYQTEFYKNYKSRAESDAQRRTIKAILHTLTHLVHESSLGIELLEQHRVPAFFRQAMFIGGSGASGAVSGVEQWSLDGSHGREISSVLADQLLQAQKHEQAAAVDESKKRKTFRTEIDEIECTAAQRTTANGRGSGRANNSANVSVKGNFKFNLTRQESFV